MSEHPHLIVSLLIHVYNTVMYCSSADRLGSSGAVMYILFFAAEGLQAKRTGACVLDAVGAGARDACSDSAKWCVALT